MIGFVKKIKLNTILLIKNDNDFRLALSQYLEKQCKKQYDPSNLNEFQKTLFLCIWLENFSISEGILTFINDIYSDYNEDVVIALNSIGAIKSSKIIKEAISLLPDDGEWFLKIANSDEKEKMRNLDKTFSSYPDGKLSLLYREYVKKHLSDL